MSSLHRETFRVRASEIGPGGGMRLPALLDLFQEAAGNSATALGWGSDRLLAEGRTWVLSRFHLRLSGLPAWREEIAVENAHVFKRHGGENFAAIACLNDSAPGMLVIWQLAMRELKGWV